MDLFTIGYEGRPQAEVIAALKSAGVEVLIDVRAIAASRRAGFSKTVLAASLEAEGVDYVHLRDLGTPKAGRQAARAGRHAEMAGVMAEQLDRPEAQLQLRQAVEIALSRPSALLCFEAEARHCHRSLIAVRMQALAPFAVTDL